MRTGQGQAVLTEADEVNKGGPGFGTRNPAARPASSGEKTGADDAHKTDVPEVGGQPELNNRKIGNENLFAGWHSP